MAGRAVEPVARAVSGVSTPPVVHRLLSRLFTVLDGEGVAFFQGIVYLHLAAAGAYSAFIARGVPSVLSEALGQPINGIWPYLCIGAVICLGGKLLSANPLKTKYWVYTTGLACQFIGDAFAMGAFLSYVLATVQEQTWGKEIVAAWIFAALAECAFFLCWRDVRRFVQAEKAVRR